MMRNEKKGSKSKGQRGRREEDIGEVSRRNRENRGNARRRERESKEGVKKRKREKREGQRRKRKTREREIYECDREGKR